LIAVIDTDTVFSKPAPMLSKEAESDLKGQLLGRQQALLDAIANGDYMTYSSLCHGDMTCFEPEARAHLVAGLDFHR